MIREFNQGELDGLCGIYALANGFVTNICQCDDVPDIAGQIAFRESLRAIPRALYPDVIIDGLTHDQLKKICLRFAKFTRENIGLTLKVETPFQSEEITSTPTFLKSIKSYYYDRPCAIILFLSFPEYKQTPSHWVAVKGFTNAPKKGITVMNNSTKNILERDMGVDGNPRVLIEVANTIIVSFVKIGRRVRSA